MQPGRTPWSADPPSTLSADPYRFQSTWGGLPSELPTPSRLKARAGWVAGRVSTARQVLHRATASGASPTVSTPASPVNAIIRQIRRHDSSTPAAVATQGHGLHLG
ncbi:hypothetical protein ACFFX0_12415 [Citricoccus parietis]|uniref:Uncharacterized protein n=1 Tax=Citricoccus parietis TaxID=592307 RepID=A0ABV5FZ62_9MICC